MAHLAPKVPTTRSADFVHYVADIGAVDPLNLTTISAKPKCAAQRIRFFSVAGGAVVVRPEVGAQQQVEAAAGNFDVTITLAANYTTEFPITHLVSTAATISAVVMWWYGTGVDINK
jgi:hypothetical protein